MTSQRTAGWRADPYDFSARYLEVVAGAVQGLAHPLSARGAGRVGVTGTEEIVELMENHDQEIRLAYPAERQG